MKEDVIILLLFLILSQNIFSGSNVLWLLTYYNNIILVKCKFIVYDVSTT